MKKQHLALLVVSLIVLMSCSGGHYNFNRKKYTNLKPIKVEQRSSRQNVQSLIKPKVTLIEPADPSADMPDWDDQTGPKRSQIKKAIADGEKIFVKIGQDFYELQDPFYDGLYDAVIGTLQPCTEAQGGLLVTANSSHNKIGKDYIYLERISDVKKVGVKTENSGQTHSTGSTLESETEQAGNQTKTTNYKKQSNTSSDVAALRIKRQHAGKTAKKNHIIGFLSILGLALGALALIFLPWYVGAVILAGMALAGYISRVIAVINYRRHAQYSKKLGLKPSKKKQAGQAFAWIGLSIYGYASLGLLLIVALLLYFLTTRKTRTK